MKLGRRPLIVPGVQDRKAVVPQLAIKNWWLNGRDGSERTGGVSAQGAAGCDPESIWQSD